MAQSLLFLNEPQTVTQWRGVGHDPVSAAECLFIDDLTGDIVVTSLVAANASKSRVSYSQARFYAGEGGCGAPTTQFSGDAASSSSVATTPSRQITSVTIGCRNGPSRPILAARRFPRPIMIRSSAVSNGSSNSNAGASSSSNSKSNNNAANANTKEPQYEPAYLIAVSIDTKTIRFYTSAPHAVTDSNKKSSTSLSNSGSATPLPQQGGSASTSQQQQQPSAESQLYFTIGLGTYMCYPNSIRFRADFYHIRHFYWACNSVKHEHARGTPSNAAAGTTSGEAGDAASFVLNNAVDANENPSRSFYSRSKLLLGGGGMIVPCPPDMSDAAIRRTVGAITSPTAGNNSNSNVSSPTAPNNNSLAGGRRGSMYFGPTNAAYNDAVERQSGISVSNQVATLYSTLQRDHMLVVFTEISVDLVFVDFRATPSSSGGTASSSGGSSAAATKGTSSGAVSSADVHSKSGCEGMIVVLRRIPTRIDFWHSVPSLHVSVVVNNAKPTNVKPIAELGGFTWIMPQFRVAGLQPIPIAASATSGLAGSPYFMSEMQLPNVVPPQHFPATPKTDNTNGAPPSHYFPLQVMHVYGELYIAFIDYSRGVIVMYRYQHNNSNGAVVDLNAAMLRATEKQQLQQQNAMVSNASITANSNASFGVSQQSFGVDANMSTVASMRYFNSQQQNDLISGNTNDSMVSNSGAGNNLPPASRLSAYALDPYKRVTSVTQVAALVAEGQAMPNTVIAANTLSAITASSPAGYGGSSPPPSGNSLTVDGNQYASFGATVSPRSRGPSTANARGSSFVDPNSVAPTDGVAGADLYLPLSDAVANAVGALEKASAAASGNKPNAANGGSSSAGTGTGTGAASNTPNTVQSAVFTGSGPNTAAAGGRPANNFAFAPNGSLVHTYSNVNDGVSGHGCSTWEVAFVLPLPAFSILSALRSEWYFGADIGASYRWFTTPNPRDSVAAYRQSVASYSGKKGSSSLDYRQSTASSAGGSAGNNAAGTDGIPLGLQAPIVLQTAADGLIYAHFPDCRAPHYTALPRGACHLVTAYDLKLAVVEGSIAGMTCGETTMVGAQLGQRSLVNASVYGDPQTVERATQSVADAYEVHCSSLSMANANTTTASPDGNAGPSSVISGGGGGRGTVLLDANTGASAAASTVASPTASPSPRRGGDRAGDGPSSAASHSSIHGISAFRALAGVSSYFTAAGSRDNLDEAALSPADLLLLRKQQWVRHVTQMRVSELSSERFVDVGDDLDNRSALYASDVLWRELLQYLCARPTPTDANQRAAGNPHPSMVVGGGGSAALSRQSVDLRGSSRASMRDGSSSNANSGGRSWIRSIFSRGGEGKSAPVEDTDFFPYAPVVHHLPLDVLTSPFEGTIRVATGGAAPIIALEPPSHHQPFIVSTVRHNALGIVSRFDCYSEEVWGLMALRAQLAALGGGGNGFSSPSRAASPAFVSGLAAAAASTTAVVEYGAPSYQPASIGIQLRRPHFGPGGHYQRSLCFAAQFILNRRAHIPRVGGSGGASAAASSSPIPIVIDTVSIVKTVLSRSITALESQAAIGRLFDVIIAHQCQNMEGAAWYRYWRTRWEGLAKSSAGNDASNSNNNKSFANNSSIFAVQGSPMMELTSNSGAAAAEGSSFDASNGGAVSPTSPAVTGAGLIAAAHQPIVHDIVARLPLATGTAVDAHIAEFARFVRALSQPHMWPVNTTHLSPVDAIAVSHPFSALSPCASPQPEGSPASSQQLFADGNGAAVAEIAILPAALDAGIVYEDVIVPLLKQLSALAAAGNGGGANTAVDSGDGSAASPRSPAYSSQAAQAGYSFFKGYVLNTLFEYCRSTVQHGLSITVPIQSSLLDLLLTSAHRTVNAAAGSPLSFNGTPVGQHGADRSFPKALLASSSSPGDGNTNTSPMRPDREISPQYIHSDDCGDEQQDGNNNNNNNGGSNNNSLYNASEAQSAYFRLHQLLMYRSLEDHIPTALQLIALQTAYPPAFQMGLDILGRLEAHSTIVQVFIARRMPMRAAKYLLYVKGLGFRSGALSSAVRVGQLPSGEDLSNIVAILECTAMLHDEERRAILDPHVPLRPVKSKAVLAREAAARNNGTGNGEEEGGDAMEEPTAEEEAQRHVAAVVSYLDNRLAKKKLKYANQLTTSGALFCNVYTMLVTQWVEVALRVHNASVASANSAGLGGGLRGRYTTADQQGGSSSRQQQQYQQQQQPSSDPSRAFPMLVPFVERFEQLKLGRTI